MISYQQSEKDGRIVVKVFNRTTGHIVPGDGGWQYVSKGATKNNGKGPVFKTVAAVKKSLEAE